MINPRKAFAWFTTVFFVFISASGAYADHQWSSYHWEKEGDELTLKVGDNHTGVWESSTFWGTNGLLNYVVSNWNTTGGSLAVVVVPGITDPNAGGTGDIESFNDDYGNNGWLGLASISVTRGKNKHIVVGQSKVNDFYIDGLPDYVRFSQIINWVHVLCQEIGHTFGLDHNRDGATGGTPDNTCMNDQTPLLEYSDPNQHDKDMLDLMYAEDHGGGGGSKEKKCHPKFGCGQGKVHAFWAEHYEDEQELFEASDAVVEATVLSSNFSHRVGGPDRAVPITRIRLKVDKVFKGKTSRVIALKQTRGPGLEIEDDPGYVTGDSYTLFLRQTGANSYRVVNPDGRTRH